MIIFSIQGHVNDETPGKNQSWIHYDIDKFFLHSCNIMTKFHLFEKMSK